MRILLVEPKYGRAWGKNNQHVGLLRIATFLQRKGHAIEYVRAPDLPNIEPDEVYVTSMFTYDYRYVWEAVQHYKFLYPNAMVRLGGIYATLAPEHAKQSMADEIFVGQHQEAKYCPPDPSVLPYKQEFAYLFTSYGCDRACTYCATHKLFGNGIEQLPADKVVDDIKFLVARGFNEIWLGDDNLLYNADRHIKPLCEAIIRAGLNVRIKIPGGMSAIDFDEDIAQLMKLAGVREFSFALESTDSSVRHRMGRAKHTKPEHIENAVRILDKLGYIREDVACYFIIGLPYQTLSDMIETLVFLIGLGIEARPMRLTPIPGTVDFARLGLDSVDLADLDYRSFVAPGQDNFTHDDLRAIQLVARAFTMQRRYIDWLAEADRASQNTEVPALFRKVLASRLA